MGNNSNLFFQRNLGQASYHSLDASARHGKLNSACRQRLLKMLPPLPSRTIDQRHRVTLLCIFHRCAPIGGRCRAGAPTRYWAYPYGRPTTGVGRGRSQGHRPEVAQAIGARPLGPLIFQPHDPGRGPLGAVPLADSRSASSSIEVLTPVNTAAPCLCSPPEWHRRPGSSR